MSNEQDEKIKAYMRDHPDIVDKVAEEHGVEVVEEEEGLPEEELEVGVPEEED